MADELVLFVVVMLCTVAALHRRLVPVLVPAAGTALLIGIASSFVRQPATSAKRSLLPPEEEEDSGAGLKQTVNPNYEAPDGSTFPPSTARTVAPAPSLPDSHVDLLAYTPTGVQMRLEERQFRPERGYQTGESRARVLNSLYKELLDTSMKGDPALRPEGVNAPCAPLRGHAAAHPV